MQRALAAHLGTLTDATWARRTSLLLASASLAALAGRLLAGLLLHAAAATAAAGGCSALSSLSRYYCSHSG
jgi:hypothetical protein